MSQSSKLSLWQRLKQLLNRSADQLAIDDVKKDKDLEPGSTLDLDLSTKDKNLFYGSQSEANATKSHSQDSNDSGEMGVSSFDHDLNRSFDSGADSVLYSSLSSNLDSQLDSSSDIDIDIDTDTYFDNDIESITKHDSNDTPIVNYLKQYFDSQQWHYNHYQPQTSDDKNSDSPQSHHLSLRISNKNLDCSYLFRVQEQNHLLAVYGILPFLIPESHQSAALLLITQINYDMMIGNLEMDINDGEIRYKNAIDVEAVGMDDHTIEHLLQTVIAMTTVTYEIFSDLVNNQNPAGELHDLLAALHQQEASRTFFLPTQFVQ